MWLKLIVCALIVAFGVFGGYLLSASYRSRSKFFAQFSRFNEQYLNELTYHRRPLPEFLALGEYVGEFAVLLNGVKEGRFSVEKLEFLSVEEKREVALYFSTLGKGDARSQADFFGAKKAYLAQMGQSSAEIAKKKGELYCKLGLLAGLAVVILIV